MPAVCWLKMNHKRNVCVAFIFGLLAQMQTLSYKTDLKILEDPLVTITIPRELLMFVCVNQLG